MDALVALTLLALVIGLSLAAAAAAQRASAKAAETRRASALLRGVLDAGGPDGSGVSQGFTWTVRRSALTSATSPVQLCRRSVQAVSQRSAARYSLAAISPCPAPDRP